MGKGSKYRRVDKAKYDRNYERISSIKYQASRIEKV